MDESMPPASCHPEDYLSQASILLVDDEEGVLNCLRRLLRKEGYRIFCAGSGEEGLRVLEEEEIDLVISDQRMPHMEGTIFLQRVKQRWPRTVRVILSGYAEPSLIVESINKGEVFRFFPKPWEDEELKAGVRQCIEHYQLQEENRRLLIRVREQNDELRRMNLELESMVETRTMSLRLAQEIVEKLPVYVFGISLEGEVLLCNDLAQKAVQRWTGINFMPGSLVEEVLPEEVLPVLEEVGRCARPVFINGRFIGDAHYYIFCDQLGGEGERGVLLIMRNMDDPAEVHLSATP